MNVILLNTKYILIFINIKMTQYNSLNVKLSNSLLNEPKSAIKDETDVVLRLSSYMIGDNETNFPHKLLLTSRQVANFRKGFAKVFANYQLIWNYQKLSYLRWYNQEEFLVAYLVHY